MILKTLGCVLIKLMWSISGIEVNYFPDTQNIKIHMQWVTKLINYLVEFFCFLYIAKTKTATLVRFSLCYSLSHIVLVYKISYE